MQTVVRRMNIVHTCLIATLLAASAGCNLQPRDVWVYVDNAGQRPLVVTVDDQLAATIAAGEVTKLSFPPGEHRFHVASGDEVVCDLVQNLEPSKQIGVCRKYLFNPDKNNRYQIYQAKYGVNRLDGVMQASLLKYQTDPQIKRQYIYRQLLKEIKLVPADAWNDVTGIDYVLTPPPDHVFTKGTARHTAIDHIPPRLYSTYERLSQIEKPTDADIDTLDELIDEILSEAL